MEIQRADKLRRPDPSPEAEIDALAVLSHHPPQEHIDPLAAGMLLRGGDMLARARWGVIQTEKIMIKRRQRPFGIPFFWRRPAVFPGSEKGIFERVVMTIVMPEEGDKIQQIGRVERAMPEMQQLFQIA